MKAPTGARRGADPTAKARDRKLKIESGYRARLLSALRAKDGSTLSTPDLLLVATAFFDNTCHDHRTQPPMVSRDIPASLHLTAHFHHAVR